MVLAKAKGLEQDHSLWEYYKTILNNIQSQSSGHQSSLEMMSDYSLTWFLPLVILLSAASDIQFSEALNGVKSSVFLSPMFVMGPGSVVSKYFHSIDFPKGHIALKSVNTEVVDEAGQPVPLQETYLHHWVIQRYYQRKSDAQAQRKHNNDQTLQESGSIYVRNSARCKSLGQYYGLGSETRRTATFLPDPYGIEVGNPADIPAGYEENWLFNVHAIDTRGVEDRLGCTECRCDLFNVTYDEFGRHLRPDYIGGLHCCHAETQCKLRDGVVSPKRNLYMRYTVKWVDWDHSIVPVKIYIFDVTDTWKSTESDGIHFCKVEYDIEPCSAPGVADTECIDIKRTSLHMPSGGYVIYGVAHQHTGGIGTALYGQDGRVLCSSIPIYGKGKEAGNEAGYIVGMSTCYPKPGFVKISNGETIILESNYSSTQMHTGAMGFFYILVADSLPNPTHIFQSPTNMLENMTTLSNFIWGVSLLGVAMMVIIVGVVYRRRNQRDKGYKSIAV